MALMSSPVLLRDIWEPCNCSRKCLCGRDELPDVGEAVEPSWLESYPRVFALDPGTHTGWACVWFDPDVVFGGQKISQSPVAWQAGMALGPEQQQVDFLLSMVCRGGRFAGPGLGVVVESFVVARISQEQTFLSPVRVGHMFAYGWHLLAGREVAAWQSPSDAKNVITDQRLRLWEMYLPGPDHPRDATRHALLWLRRLRQNGEDLYDASHFGNGEA